MHVKECEANGDSSSYLGMGHFYNGWDPAWVIADLNVPFDKLDVDNNLHQLVVQIDTKPENMQGDLWLYIGGSKNLSGTWQGGQWVRLGHQSTFSMADVYEGRVRYQHDSQNQVWNELVPGSEHDSFSYTIRDGAGGQINHDIHIVITPVNQAPQIIVKPGGIIDEERVDSYPEEDPETHEILPHYNIWIYEGEQGAPFSVHVSDVDQVDPTCVLRFTELPDSYHGYFWYDDGSGYKKVTTSTELDLVRVQDGFLRFCHSGKEDSSSFTFKLAVTDDGGGEKKSDSSLNRLTTETTLQINVRPNNDCPEWDSSLKDGSDPMWDDGEHTEYITGTRDIWLDSRFWKTVDNDSDQQSITYTIESFDSSKGWLLYDTKTTDNEGKAIYKMYKAGDKISQKDITDGKIFWRFKCATGEVTTTAQVDIEFTVRDGSKSAIPVPSDSEQPVNYPFDGSSSTNWQHGSGPHESSIGKWLDTGNGYEWVTTVHTLHIVANNIPAGEGGTMPITVDPVPRFDPTSPITSKEGNFVNIDNTMLKSWFTSGSNSVNITDDPAYPAASSYNLTYRITETPGVGYILYSKDSGHTVTRIGLHGSFTQADIDAGYIYYWHGGSEVFTDSFNFTISDGRTEITNDGVAFEQKINITPRNDSPELREGSHLEVLEHDSPINNDAKTTSPGGIGTITTGQISVHDRDLTDTDLYVVITQGPSHGRLFLDKNNNGVFDPGEEIQIVSHSAIKDGAGYKDWVDPSGSYGGNPPFSIIKYSDIAAGKLKYQHDGTENYYDDFKYTASDANGILPDDPDHVAYMLAGGTLEVIAKNQASVSQSERGVNVVVKPVNDRPEPNQSRPIQNLKVSEGGEAVFNASGDNIAYTDPDNPDQAIQFIIKTKPEHGTLYLNGKLLGEGSTFTQGDVDSGRLKYEHDGTEYHSDRFECYISDSIYSSKTEGLFDTFNIDVTPKNKAPIINIPDETIYVESIAGGVIIKKIEIRDPDYGPAIESNPNPWDLDYTSTGSGIVRDKMTVILDFSTTDSTKVDDMAKVLIGFSNSEAGIIKDIAVNNASSKVIILTGSYKDLMKALRETTISTKHLGGAHDNYYDPNGDIQIKVTVVDGVLKSGVDTSNKSNLYIKSNYKDPNGSNDNSEIGMSDSSIKVLISPLNDPPKAKTDSPTSISCDEDSGWQAVKTSDGKSLQIEDPDAASRPGNSIILSVEHGTLQLAGKNGKSIEINGTLAQINSWLAQLKYKADANFNGSDVIKFIYKDNANNGQLDETGTTFDKLEDHVTVSDPFKELVNGTNYQYTTGRKLSPSDHNFIQGLAYYGEIGISVKAINDAPVIKAPSDLYIKQDTSFNGVDKDILGTTAAIVIDDIDISAPSSNRGDDTFFDDTITVKLAVTKGTLNLTGSLSGSAAITEGADGTNTITLKGPLADINASLKLIKYIPAQWTELTDVMTITVTDPGTGSNASNGAPDGGYETVVHTINIFGNDNNNAPTISLPGSAWSVLEDTDPVRAGVIAVEKAASKVFQGITVSDHDIFDRKIYVQISVDSGEIIFSDAAKKLTLSGNPALRDAINRSGDGKTVYLYGDIKKVNAAIKELMFKPGNNFNGEVNVSILTNDLGMLGEPTGAEQLVPGNTINVSGQGLEARANHKINVISVNDAPVVGSITNIDFSKDNPVLEDTTALNPAGLMPRTVDNLFSGAFSDSADNQTGHAGGSSSNNFAGIVIVGNAANSTTQGTWQYSADGTNWVNIGACSTSNALYLGKDVAMRFLPVENFNGYPGRLTLHLVDDSALEQGAHDHNNITNPYPDVSANVTDPSKLTGAVSGVDLSGANKVGGITRYSQGTLTLSTLITAVNDAPLITTGKETVTLTVTEDVKESDNPGNKVIDLFRGSLDDSTDNVTGGSAANTLAGVVITGVTESANGVWKYSIDDGNTWIKIPCGAETNAVSESNGLFLVNEARIYFFPVSDFNTTASDMTGSITVRVVDNCMADSTAIPAITACPGNNTRVDVSGTAADGKAGGNTRYSLGSVTLNAKVNAVNDAPVVSESNVVKELDAVSEGAANPVGQSLSNLLGSYFSDEKDNQKDGGTNPGGSASNSLAGIMVVDYTRDSSKGEWQFSLNNGSSWQSIDANVSLAKSWWIPGADPNTTLVRFVPKGDYNGEPPQIKVLLVESGHAFGNTASTSTNTRDLSVAAATGGIGRVSSADNPITLKIKVNAVNDAPGIVSGKENVERTVQEDSTVTTPANTWKVDDLFKDSLDDSKDAQKHVTNNPNGSVANILEGVLVTGVDSTNGEWFFSQDNGSSWTKFSGVGSNSAVYLSKDALVRFVPNGDFNTVGTTVDFTARLYESSASASEYASGQTNIVIPAYDATGRISQNSVNFKITVTPVNDAPTIDPSKPRTITLSPIAEDSQPSGTSLGTLLNGYFKDAADDKSALGGSLADTFAGVMITGHQFDSSKGCWQYSKDSGNSWTSITACSLNSALYIQINSTMLRFLPATDFNGKPADLKMLVVETQGGLSPFVEGSRHNLAVAGATGGTSKVSDKSDAITVEISVSAVNDAPIANSTPKSIVVHENDGVNTGQIGYNQWTMSELFASSFSDLKDNQRNAVSNPTGSLSNTFAGVLITALDLDSEHGEWYYNNGGGWVQITSVDQMNALYLGHNDKISFVPAVDFANNHLVGGVPLPPVSLEGKLVEQGITVHVSGSSYDISGAHDPIGQISAAGVTLDLWVGGLPPPPSKDIPVHVPVKKDGSKFQGAHLLEDDEAFKKYKDVFKDMEVKKPVLISVNDAYTFTRQSTDDKLANVNAKTVDKLNRYEEAFISLNSISIVRGGASVVMTGEAEIAFFVVGEENAIRLSANLFHCSDMKEELGYFASLANGEPLPAWLVFDASSLTFKGVPPVDEQADSFELVVTARALNGREDYVRLTINLNRDSQEAEEVLASLPGLRSQLSSNGQSGLMKAAQDFLRSIYMLS